MINWLRHLWNNPVVKDTNKIYPWIVLIGTIISTDMSIIAAIAESLADPYMRGFFAIGVTHNAWIGTIFLLSVVSVIPICMRFGLMFGYKRVFFIGNLVFYVGSLFVGLSPSYPIVLASRVIAGIGAGILLNFCIAYIARSFPKNLLPLALSLYTAFGFGMGYIIGSIMGGLFSQVYVSWQMIFYFTFFVGFIPLGMIFFCFSETKKQEVPPFDFWGYLFFLAFIYSAMMLTMNVKAPWNSNGWYSSFTHTCIIVILVSLIGLIIVELRQKHPLFLLKHFAIRAFSLGTISLFLIGCLLFGTASVFPGMLNESLGWPMYKVGLYMSLFGVFIGVSGAVVGLLSDKIGIRIPTIIGLILVSISCFVQHSFTIYSEHKDLFIILTLRGIGIGSALGPVTSLALYRINESEVPKAAVLATILRQLGAAFGANILFIISAERYPFHLRHFGSMMNKDSPMYQHVFRNLYTYFVDITGASPLLAEEKAKLHIGDFVSRQARVVADNDAFFIIGIVVSCITVVLAFLMLQKYVRTKINTAKQRNKLTKS